VSRSQWICSPLQEPYPGALNFTKTVTPAGPLQSARLAVSSLGIYRAQIGGADITRRVLTPGFTSYDKRGIQRQEYDVTRFFRPGEPAELAVAVAPGWAVGHFGFAGNDRIYADRVCLWAELTLTYEDGARETVGADPTWQVYTHPVIYADLYKGETVDLTHVPRCVGNARVAEVPYPLIPDMGEEIREQEILTPVLIHTPKGERVLDFGQNMTGYVCLHIRGERGGRVALSFGEVLDKEGNFYNENYRSARGQVIYILSGGEDEFKPRFSFQGFRYVRVDEYPEDPVDPEGFRGIVVHSQMERTGRFSCGNEKVNQLYHNIIWGQKSNYLDIPTDCPQRDERMGWTGDAQVFCSTAALNYDVRTFFRKWLADLRAEQGERGEIFGTCPERTGASGSAHSKVSAAWGDAAVLIPWTLYQQYGDLSVLSENFDMMRRWVDYQRSAGPEEYLWLSGDHYGDWLALDAGEDGYVGATSTDLIGSAFFARSAELVIRAGEALGREVSDYRKLYENIRRAYRQAFLEEVLACEIPSGQPDTLGGKLTQTALVLALQFGLCRQEERPVLTEKLVKLIAAFGGRMSTGFVGTPYLLHVLADNGRADLAYDLLLSEKQPSWLYSVDRGATTMWEHWNGIKENGDFWSPHMNSFNHYAYGAVGDWLYRVCAGVRAEAPGYERVTLAPVPDRRLVRADCSVSTLRGTLESHWRYTAEGILYSFTVPEGITALIRLPEGYTRQVTGGTYRFFRRRGQA